MSSFFQTLAQRNNALFIFGALNLAAAIVFLMLAGFTDFQIRGANAWLKPFKFALSIGIYAWTMGWFTGYLQELSTIRLFNWTVIILLTYEVAYIALQAGRGLTSHYNASTPLYSFLAAMMGIGAAVVTLCTAYIGLLFCTKAFPDLPDYYLLSIRIGIFLFVIFAFGGAAMGSRQSHTVGGPEGGPALPILNWSTRFGDLRVAHFLGMHALQLLPLLSWYVLKNTKLVTIMGLLYLALAIFAFIKALHGRPMINS